MKMRSAGPALVAGSLLFCATAPAWAIDFQSDDWKFSLDGNVNVDYIYSSCEGASSAHTVAGGLACVGSASGSSVSNISNGLLPAAFTFGVATTQDDIDLSAHLGLYPGIATNDGGSPNLQSGGSNTALGTTGLDVRQVYMTFGNKNWGTFLLGRNFGLFGFDVIINDMTLPGVGGPGGSASAAPANTTLGSIGLGYIYTDTLGQIDYTTPDFAGFTATIGIYDPLNAINGAGAVIGGKFVPDSPQPKSAPGFHGKLAYKLDFGGGTKLYLSSAFITQKQKFIAAATGNPYSYNALGIDAFAMLDISDFELFGYYYHGSGLGTTGLFVFADDGLGNKRSSNGYLIQGTYKIGKWKLGVNYGDSSLDLASGETNPTLVKDNRKVTGGVYYSLTKNLTLLGEVTNVDAKNHAGDSNNATTVNVGAFLSF